MPLVIHSVEGKGRISKQGLNISIDPSDPMQLNITEGSITVDGETYNYVATSIPFTSHATYDKIVKIVAEKDGIVRCYEVLNDGYQELPLVPDAVFLLASLVITPNQTELSREEVHIIELI